MAAAKPEINEAPAILKALQAIREHCDKEGISKDREVKDGIKFKFRGIDDVMNFFSGPLAHNHVMVLPSYDGILVSERATKNGSTFNTKVAGTLRFISTKDGSELVAGPFYGEANDTQDKATAKAMSIAFRQGFLLTFTVPLGPAMDTEYGDQLDDEPAVKLSPVTSEPISKSAPKPATQPAAESVADELKDGQKRILTATLERKGLTMSDLAVDFPTINTANFNDVLAWIKAQDGA